MILCFYGFSPKSATWNEFINMLKYRVGLMQSFLG
jgi:hypothetical protein